MSRRAKNAERRTFLSDFREFFFRGLAILLPTVLTLWLLVQAYLFVDAQVAEPINRGIRAGVIQVMPRVLDEEHMPDWFRVPDARVEARYAEQIEQGDIEPPEGDDAIAAVKLQMREDLRAEQFRRQWEEHWYLRVIGLLVAITLIYFAGMLLSGFIGRRIFARLERLLTSIPGFKQVYPHVKQVVDLILGDKPMAFRQVVLVQYPREGIWTVGLVTSSSMKMVRHLAEGEVVSIFVPSTPTPFTGFTINVAKRDVVELPISVDEAIRFFITGGVLIPEEQANEPMSEFQKKAAAAMARAEKDGEGTEQAPDAGEGQAGGKGSPTGDGEG